VATTAPSFEGGGPKEGAGSLKCSHFTALRVRARSGSEGRCPAGGFVQRPAAPHRREPHRCPGGPRIAPQRNVSPAQRQGGSPWDHRRARHPPSVQPPLMTPDLPLSPTHIP
jgi:hypothetical protein